MNNITKSEKWILEALLKIMTTKPYDKIKIKEIASLADLNTRTFYRHFKTKDDVLKLYGRKLSIELSNKILEKSPCFKTIILDYFEFLNEHIEFLNLLLKHNMLHFLYDNLDSFMTEVAFIVKPHLKNQDIDTKTLYQFYFNIGGFFYITTKWLKSNPRLSKEEMASIILDMFS
ncbi:TetR/AcrR family transcriptional regulator [Clostridium felsineum]|uniref:TetR/AcrR family transcriptional regulator n=1 Tax=Clostridium felsineum TaxID=36839 RepID=UPI00098BD386|nr:TetR/AcrR family transcriptional regulator [Clostridium felsineum]URZ18760.1 hypothetical protein CLFE_048480 [Clostridium felsineum DSM 794]